MKLSTIHTSHGRVISIETDEHLDLRAEGVFRHACQLAEDPDLGAIEVNLEKTRRIRGSGVAMLNMLRERTSLEKNPIRLVNCSPEIRRQLLTCNVGRQFHVT